MTQDNSYPGVTVSLLKGGVGKSTIALNVADQLSKKGNDVVLVDLDMDGHMTTQLGYYDEFENGAGLGEVLFGDKEAEELLIETDFGVSLFPSNTQMESTQDQVKNSPLPNTAIANGVLDPLYEAGYDYFVVDAPGQRGKLSDNALIGTQRLIIPLTPGAGSINGLMKMMDRQIKPLDQRVGIDILAITPNRIQKTMNQRNQHRILVENINKRFGQYVPEYARIEDEVFDALDANTVSEYPKPGIRERGSITKAFKDGLPVSEYDPECDQISVFRELAEVVIERSPNKPQDSTDQLEQ